MPYPIYRPRRLRESPLIRKMVRETTLRTEDLIYPLFTLHGRGVRESIPSMPGQFRLSIDELLKECKDAASMGIPAVLLFGIPQEKDARGSEAYAEDGIIQQAVRVVKETVPDLLVVTDVCLCEYTSHGHCGVVEDGRVKNDPTLDLIARTALSHVEAGADMVAPSDMMDGRVAAIREALDESGYQEAPIMAYSAKYASAFYGPFRDAVRRPASVPDGSGQRRRGHAGGRPRRGRGRRHRDDQARPRVSGHHLAREDGVRAPGGRLLRLRRVCDDPGGGTARLDRRGARHGGGAHGDPARRGRHRHHVLREGPREADRAGPGVRVSAKGEYAIKALLDLALHDREGLQPIQEIGRASCRE